jgi:1-acyl-sn-glycerol-3-phosphate acyltransferase
MYRLICWLVTIPFLLAFVSTLLFFQLVLMLGNLLGRPAFELALLGMNHGVQLCLRMTGARFRFSCPELGGIQAPVIIVANHQSMFDIPLFILYLRKFRPRFVAKRELGRGVPSVSFALRNGGSVLIDRGKPAQAIPAIRAWAKTLTQTASSACIFPEGTRARDGQMKRFKMAGLIALLEELPEASVLPVAVENSWQLVRHGLFPVPLGIEVRMQVLTPIARGSLSPEEICALCEKQIRAVVHPEQQDERANKDPSKDGVAA